MIRSVLGLVCAAIVCAGILCMAGCNENSLDGSGSTVMRGSGK